MADKEKLEGCPLFFQHQVFLILLYQDE